MLKEKILQIYIHPNFEIETAIDTLNSDNKYE